MPQPQVINFTSYFMQERDVYIQNVSGTQVSMTFDLGGGMKEAITIPDSRKPRNLTQDIPFEIIKRNMDLRKLLNRTPPALKLLTEEEYLAYYERVAEQNKTKAEDEMNKAASYHAEFNAKVRSQQPDITAEKPKRIDEVRVEAAGASSPDDEITPRVIGLCNQVGPDVPDKHRISANDLLDTFQGMEGNLTKADYDYIGGHGYYKAVKKWAMQKLDEISPPPSEE